MAQLLRGLSYINVFISTAPPGGKRYYLCPTNEEKHLKEV